MLVRLLAAAALAAAPAIAAATTIIDGSFEAAGTGVTDYCYDGVAAGGNAACPPGAWGVNGGVIHSGSAAWGGTTTPDGNYYGMLQANETLSQTVVATATGGLALNWIDTNRNGYGIHSYTVTVNGATLGTYSSTYGAFVPKTSGEFGVVAGQSYTIAFNGLANGDTTSFIDGVALTAVPDAPTWALLVAGFGLVGVAARRRSLAAA